MADLQWATAALDQIADAIRPVLQEIEDRFHSGQRIAPIRKQPSAETR
jgi:hypothetical protein